MVKELWTRAQVAEAMAVSEDTVRRLTDSGQLPAIRVSPRAWRYDPLDVYAYLDSRKTKAAALQRRTRGRKPAEIRGGVNNSGYYPGMKVV